MSNVEIWRRASELYAALGLHARKFALRQAIHAKRNGEAHLFEDWLIVASRIGAVASLRLAN